MSVNEHVVLTPEITVIPFARVQCTKNRLTHENYVANYKIFQERQLNSRRFPVFPGAISNSRISRSCRQTPWIVKRSKHCRQIHTTKNCWSYKEKQEQHTVQQVTAIGWQRYLTSTCPKTLRVNQSWSWLRHYAIIMRPSLAK